MLVGVTRAIRVIVLTTVCRKLGRGPVVLLMMQKLLGTELGLKGPLLCVVSVGWNLSLLSLAALRRLMRMRT